MRTGNRYFISSVYAHQRRPAAFAHFPLAVNPPVFFIRARMIPLRFLSREHRHSPLHAPRLPGRQQHVLAARCRSRGAHPDRTRAMYTAVASDGGFRYDRLVRLLAARGAVSPPDSSVAQWQSIRLLTGGLLVRVQPEEPAFAHD